MSLAHRRVRALGLVGLAVTLIKAGLVTIAVAWVGAKPSATGDVRSDRPPGRPEVYFAFPEPGLVLQSVLLIVVGLFIALIAWAIQRRRQVVDAFDDRGDALTDADAHRREAVAPAAPLELVGDIVMSRAPLIPSGWPRDRPAVRVDLVGVEAQLAMQAIPCWANASFSSIRSRS